MPITGPRDGFKRVRDGLGKAEQAAADATKKATHQLIREQFFTSSGPDGQAYKKTVDGKPALQSKKLPQAFTSVWSGKSLRVVGKSKRDLLEGHDEGHTFAPRNVDGRSTILRYNAKGRLVTMKRYAKLKRGRAVFARAHVVGQRVLPRRQIAPSGSHLPPRWDQRLSSASRDALNKVLRPALR